MTDGILVCGDTKRVPELRHEVPVSIGDRLLYAEHGGRRYVVVPALRRPLLASQDEIEPVTLEELGYDELLDRGLPHEEARLETFTTACRAFGISTAVVPPSFPLDVAQRLHADGIALVVDRPLFEARRRRKTDAELAGIRRAQRAAEAAAAAVREAVRAAEVRGDELLSGGEPLSPAFLKTVLRRACAEHGAHVEDVSVDGGIDAEDFDELRPFRVGEPIVLDVVPRDESSGCCADMSRTFAFGRPAPELERFHALVLEALERATAAVHEGLAAKSLHELVCDLFHEHGFPTQLTGGPGLRDGFVHALGHGVGLEVHEPPLLGRTDDVLLAGDVITLEPGLYRDGFGGCRLEDLVRVTPDGAELLTDFPYDLAS